MRLNINTSPSRFFRQFLEVIRSIPPLDTLRSRELDVLAMIMFYNYKYRTLDEDIKWRIINDSSTKKEIHARLEMSEDVFNNNLSLVRKAGLIDKETGRLPKFLQVIPEKEYEIIFHFKLEEDGV